MLPPGTRYGDVWNDWAACDLSRGRPDNILALVTQENDRQDVLPLFPLNVVLFPGMPLPLHIFEERYQQMIGECLEHDIPFGIVLIKEGPEVGGPAEPYTVGTTARIAQVERLDGGRMNLMTEGKRRFRIAEITQQSPYLKGRVQYIAEEQGQPLEETVREASELFASYLQSVSGLRGRWMSRARVPEDALALSYTISHFLELSPHTRQQLLEADSVQQRLEEVMPLLRNRADKARQALVRRTPFQGFRLN